MNHAYSLEDFHGFYGHWVPSVHTYCLLFLGDKDRAEEATTNTFFTYFSEVGKLFKGIKELPLDRVPLSLFRKTVQVAASGWIPDSPDYGGPSFEDAVSSLPRNERSVFILRGPLNLDSEQTAAVTGFPKEDVQQLWVRALLQLKNSWLHRPKPQPSGPTSGDSSWRPNLEGA